MKPRGGLEESAARGDHPFTWKKLQCLKMIFRPFGEKKIKKNWIWKMTLADLPPPGYGIFHKYFFFFEPFLKRLVKTLQVKAWLHFECFWQTQKIEAYITSSLFTGLNVWYKDLHIQTWLKIIESFPIYPFFYIRFHAFLTTLTERQRFMKTFYCCKWCKRICRVMTENFCR